MSLGVRKVGVPGVAQPSKICEDVLCPFHGHLKVRGTFIEGSLIKMRGTRFGTVQRTYTYYNKKYKRYERRRSKIHVRVPDCLEVREGDRVIIGETRPLAKSVSFVVLGKR
ncbi:30S ribosomal protein S17 [Sulfodiicoccus acidiphilus]|uniref:Small ribosomal subunit protein uS17 n=1 Tax=Sulfodiicoccus acidiphilus TaxID=1670455 RepID=A0A348B151_9CREN|nr:30S ribosomal protein S17 [Sulfodiicoccus acidiphilus]BBD71903.1 30S ribosomal protein S17 [Sulfodiicoccus acidiphilus]GGT91330.1 30S ribosomal protein S17 [Sulfodiicoccus acidiphilus]